MCTGKCARCVADLLFPLAVAAIVGNILLFFPNGEVWRSEEITEEVWYLPGAIGGGILVLLPAELIRAAGVEGSCCANRCGMLVSMVISVVGVAGSLFCMVVSTLGLQRGPLCYDDNDELTCPFINLTTEESYLFNSTLWGVCVRPVNVVLWNIVLFSVLLSVGSLEAVLSLSQVVNGLLGCLCGTCMGNRQTGTTA